MATLAERSGRPDLPVTVLSCGAGYYIGTFCPQEGPYSRESLEYWPTAAEAETALASGNWTQRQNP